MKWKGQPGPENDAPISGCTSGMVLVAIVVLLTMAYVYRQWPLAFLAAALIAWLVTQPRGRI